jgi:UDP-2,3-diacylglucosamine pyrophosphatase LpxH
MPNKSTSYKQVTVKEIPRTSLMEAGIYRLSLPDGAKVIALANARWPHQDRALDAMFKQFITDQQPDVVVLLGQMLDHEAFKSLTEDERNYLHKHPDTQEVSTARDAGSFDDQVKSLREQAGEYIKSFAIGKTKVFFIPGVSTEYKIMEWVQQEKGFRDNWASNHPEAADQPSDPDRKIPSQFDKFLYLNKSARVKVLPYEAALLINDHTLYMIGDFKRRHPGDAVYVEWEQRQYSLVRSFDGKLSSGWHTLMKHTQPTMEKEYHETHEVGYFWDDLLNGHLRDYDRRAQGFFFGEYHLGELFAETAFVMRGTDNRRSFVVNGKPYTEETPGGLSNGGEVTLGDEPESEDEEWNIFSEPAPEGAEGENGGKAEAVVEAPAPAPVANKPAAKKALVKTAAKKATAAKKPSGKKAVRKPAVKTASKRPAKNRTKK